MSPSSLRAAVGGHRLVGEVRGEGLIAAVELVADRESGEPFPAERRTGLRLYEILLDEGLVSRALGDSVALCPPLVIDDGEQAELLRRFTRGLERLGTAP